MKLRRCSYILFLSAVLCAVFGLINVLASNTDQVVINGTSVSEGEQIIATISMNANNQLMSACTGNITYDKDVLEVAEVTNIYGNLKYSKGESAIGFAVADAVNGMNFADETVLVAVKFKVKPVNKDKSDIVCNILEAYSLDKNNSKDVAISELSSLTTTKVSVVGGDKKETDEEKGTDGNEITDDKIVNPTVAPTVIDDYDNVPKTADSVYSRTMVLLALGVVFGVSGIICYRKTKKTPVRYR